MGGWFAAREIEGTETVTKTTTVSVTTSADALESGLPDAVEETRAALLAAAEAGDYEALRPLIPRRDSSTRSEAPSWVFFVAGD